MITRLVIIELIMSILSEAQVVRARLDLFAPALFVLLWSTGFIGAKLGLPYVEPFTFLLLRFCIAAVLIAGLALLLRSPWPHNPQAYGHSIVVGLLLQGVYLGGVFFAIHLGMSAGLSALIVGLQPLLTGVLGQVLLRERVTLRQWLGLGLGLLGVGLVLIEPVLRSVGQKPVPPLALASVVCALLGTTLGTLYQRRYGRELPLLSATSVQFAAGALLMLPLALGLETMHIQWALPFVFALSWLVLVLSCGAILLLMVLIRRSSATRVASLFYLVPPATAIEAYLLFNERLGPLALLGLVASVAGVALVLSQQAASTAP